MNSIKRVDILAVLTYFVLLSFAKLRWLNHVGVHAEQYWIIRNRNLSPAQGLFYSDPSRTFMSFFFGIIYRFAGENFYIYVIFNQILTILIGILVFVICRTLKVNTLLAFLVSIFAGLAIPDDSSFLFSMLVVKQCAITLLIIVYLTSTPAVRRFEGFRIIAISFLGFFCLFTYEVTLFPLVVIFTRLFLRNRREGFRDLHLAVMAPIVFFLSWTIFRYFVLGRDSYQSGKVRIPSFQDIGASLTKYLSIFNPFSWDDHENELFLGCVDRAQEIIGTFPIVLTSLMIFLFFGLRFLFNRISYREYASHSLTNSADARYFLSLMIVSYLPYLLISDGASNWRTHLIAQGFLAISLGLFLQGISKSSISFNFSLIALLIFASLSMFFGVSTTNLQTLHVAKYWNDHQKFFKGLTQLAPSINTGYFLLVVDVPTGANYCESQKRDIFEDPYWLQAGIHTYYGELWDPKSPTKIAMYLNRTLTPEDFAYSGDEYLSLNITKGDQLVAMNKVIIVSINNGFPKLVTQTELQSQLGLKLNSYAPMVGISNVIDPNDLESRLNLLVTRLDTP